MSIQFLFRWILVITPLCSFEQTIDIKNTSITKPDSNILYSYADNHLKINNYRNLLNLKITASNGSITETINEKGFFCLIPKDLSNDTLEVFDKGRLVLKKIFKVDSISKVEARVGDFLDTALSIQQLLSSPYLNIVCIGTCYKLLVKVISFKTIFIISEIEKVEFDFTNESNRFNSKLVSEILKLKKRDKILFTEIRIVGPNGRQRELPNLNILIN